MSVKLNFPYLYITFQWQTLFVLSFWVTVNSRKIVPGSCCLSDPMHLPTSVNGAAMTYLRVDRKRIQTSTQIWMYHPVLDTKLIQVIKKNCKK